MVMRFARNDTSDSCFLLYPFLTVPCHSRHGVRFIFFAAKGCGCGGLVPIRVGVWLLPTGRGQAQGPPSAAASAPCPYAPPLCGVRQLSGYRSEWQSEADMRTLARTTFGGNGTTMRRNDGLDDSKAQTTPTG